MTVLLSRNRQPPPTVAVGVPLAAELISLPSGLLALVCEAIVKLKVRLGAACACVRVRVFSLYLVCLGHRRGPTRSGRMHSAVHWGRGSACL